MKSELTPEIVLAAREEIAAGAMGLRSDIAANTTDLRAQIVASATGLRSDIAASATELRAEIVAGATDLRSEIAATAVETRRHFDVVADRLMDKIQLVGEGVIFRGEVGDEFRRVDRRLLRLDAKLFG